MPTTTGIATSFIDFTRASNATVTDSDGKVKWAPHNLLLASESFDAAAWTKSSVTPTANSIAAPNGTTTADTLAASGANGTTLQTFTAEAISYTFGVWLKRKTGTGNIQIAADSGTYTTVTITSDWALYTVTQTPAAGSKSAGIRIVTSADEVYAWGASLYRSDLAMQPNTSAYPMYNPTTPKNLLGYTESLTTGWTNSNTTDAIVSEVNPVGLTGAVDVAATAGNGTLLSSLSLLASPYTFSVWLKRKTGSGTVEITVDGTTYVAAAVTGTWTRFSTTLTPTAGTKTPGIRLVTSGDAVYAWGAQLSDSASLDSYSPVYGAAVTSAAYYGPRRDFDPVTLACKGLLVEEQRSNLMTYSADISQWTAQAGVTVTVNQAVAPDGAMTADLITGNGTTGVISPGATVSGASNNTKSIWLRAVTGTTSVILKDANVTIGSVTCNLTTTWQRFTLSETQSGGVASIWIDDVVAGGIYAWGGQIEQGSFATSYIPTGAATATRNADVASVSTQAFPYSATEGTIVVNYDRVGIQSLSRLFTLGDAVGDSQVSILNYTTGQENPYFVTSGVQTIVTGPSIPAANAVSKMGLAFKTGDNAYSLNGATATANATSFTLSATALSLGNVLSVYQLNGHIRQITYLPRRVTNAELQTRTT